MSADQREASTKRDENVGLLFGYHKEMYRDRKSKASLTQQFCAVYCGRGSVTSWTISFSIGLMIMGVLCALYGYFLPSMYLSLSPEIDANMTVTERSKDRFERELTSLHEMYNDRDIFIASGLVVLFLGGLMMSLSLLVPLCIGESIDRVPSSSHIRVKNELGTATARRTDNCLNPFTEETHH